MVRWACGIFTAFLVFSFFPCSVWAEDTFAEKLERLERDVNALQRQVYKGKYIPSQTVGFGEDENISDVNADSGVNNDTDVDAEFIKKSALESQIAALTDGQEQLNHKADRLRQDLDRLAADVNIRLTALEDAESNRLQREKEALAAAQARADEARLLKESQAAEEAALKKAAELQARTIPEIQAKPDFPKIDKAENSTKVIGKDAAEAKGFDLRPDETGVSAKQAYDEAFSLIKQSKYVQAESTFKDFIKNYPDDTLVPNAIYWLGESYYARGDYAAAAVTFAEGYEKYPDSNKAPDCFLKLGLAMSALGKKDEACVVFVSYAERYPNALKIFKDRAAKEVGRNQCK